MKTSEIINTHSMNPNRNPLYNNNEIITNKSIRLKSGRVRTPISPPIKTKEIILEENWNSRFNLDPHSTFDMFMPGGYDQNCK